jgi:hypothetical protein
MGQREMDEWEKAGKVERGGGERGKENGIEWGRKEGREEESIPEIALSKMHSFWLDGQEIWGF